METIISPDGTPIVYHCSGEGSPLVLVHGTSGSSRRWTAVLPALVAHGCVCAVDRRGYGASGDSPAYAIEREFEDIAAVVDSFGEPVDLLGHSFGALCALEAALRTRNLRKLILYEPPIPLPGVSLYAEGVLDRLTAMLEAGDHEGLLTLFFREVVQAPPHEIDRLRSAPTWPARLAAAHAVVRESWAEVRYRFEAQRFRELSLPTLLLSGGASPPVFKAMTEAVHAAVPTSRLVTLPGQQHIAMDTAPELFLREVLAFLHEPS